MLGRSIRWTRLVCTGCLLRMPLPPLPSPACLHAGAVQLQEHSCRPCLYLQRYWIKDIDTGTVYVIEGDDGGTAGGTAGAAGAAGGAASEGRVTELLSGRELRWVPLPLGS